MTEKLDEIWRDDLLHRRNEAIFLQRYLDQAYIEPTKALNRSSFVVNLKGDWGSGKTYFLKRFAQQLRTSRKLVVEIDAWNADPNIDPLVTIVSEIKSQIEANFPKRSKVRAALTGLQNAGGAASISFLSTAFKHNVRRVVGGALDQGLDAIEDAPGLDSISDASIENFSESIQLGTDSAVDEVFEGLQAGSYFKRRMLFATLQQTGVRRFCKSVESLTTNIEKSSKKHDLPVYILIDELDRCRPTFAIELLERVNHLFDASGVVFVIATDSDELAHSVKAVYGNSFGASGYLNRFFSYTYYLATPDNSDYVDMLLNDLSIDASKFSVGARSDPLELIKEMLLHTIDTPRALRQVLFLLKTFSDTWERQAKIDAAYATACALIVFLNPRSDHELYLKKNFQLSDIGIKLTHISWPYHRRNDGKRSAARILNYINQISHWSSLTIKEAIRECDQQGSEFSDHFRNNLIADEPSAEQNRYRDGQPISHRYMELMRTASHLHEDSAT